MPLTYLDTSALTKHYVPELGSAWVQTIVRTESIAISRLATAELASVLARRFREGTLTAGQRDGIYHQFLVDAQGFMIIELTRRLVEQAAVLFLVNQPPARLRSLDALHVACAQAAFARARRTGIATGDFVSADRALLETARALGLTTSNPEDFP